MKKLILFKKNACYYLLVQTIFFWNLIHWRTDYKDNVFFKINSTPESNSIGTKLHEYNFKLQNERGVKTIMIYFNHKNYISQIQKTYRDSIAKINIKYYTLVKDLFFRKYAIYMEKSIDLNEKNITEIFKF